MAATDSTLPPRNYVFVGIAGGPMRLHFDCPLTPYTNESVVRNENVLTRFTSSNAAAYVSTPITRNGVTVNMPYLWNCTLPTSGGGSVPMANLLDNMLMIRGINNGSDGHDLNYYKTTRPVNQGASIDGAVADRSTAPIPNVGLLRANSSAFKSTLGVSPTMISNQDNPLQSILTAFDRTPDGLDGNFMSRQQAMDEAMKQAMQSLGNYAKSSIPGSENLYALRSTAEKVIRAGIGDVQSVYQGLYQKYSALMSAAASAIPGITDTSVRANSVNPMGCRFSSPRIGYVGGNSDLCRIPTANSRISFLAENFAIAEYLLMNGFTSSVNLGLSEIQNLNYQQCFAYDGSSLGNLTNGGWVADEHEQGGYLSMIVNAYFWRATAACIYELATVLKTKNLWKDTVVHIAGDFGRNARSNGSGSDHGWMANSVSIVSGAVNKPYVVGNTRWNGSPYTGDAYGGTWGASAPTVVDGQPQDLTLGHAASTICHLLRVATPTPNNNPLFIEQADGNIVPAVELARNV